MNARTRSHLIEGFDTTTPGAVPSKPALVAGYVDGRWPTYDLLRSEHPDALALSITVTGRTDALILDCENGDASIAGAVSWIIAMHRRGVWRPAVYLSMARVVALEEAARKRAIPRNGYRLWSAHWTDRAHICGPECGLEGEPPGMTQYSDHGEHGENVDRSLTTRGWVMAVLKSEPGATA